METKRQRLNDEEQHNALITGGSFCIGDNVRLINLTAYPGLEGLIATVVGADADQHRIHVKLHKNGVIKRVSS